jgi:uncharacterized iron-regulated protein
MRCPALIALFAVGCAGSRAVTPPPDLPPKLPHAIYKLSDGKAAPSSDGDFDRATASARAIYAGEEHDDPHQHAFELELFERLYAQDPSLGLALEMLPASAQPALDQFLDGKIDEAAFLAAVDWTHAWGYPFNYYRPLLALCRARHLHAYALNAPHALARDIAHKGVAGLSADERAALPEMVPGPPEHRAQLTEAFHAHGGEAHAHLSDGALDHFYEAQLLWDETMASNVARALSQPSAPHRLFVVVGEGHARRFAIPIRAQRRGITPDVVVLPVYRKNLDETTEPAVDFLWVIERGAGVAHHADAR